MSTRRKHFCIYVEKNMKFTMTTITVDTPNKYGTIFPRDVVEKGLIKYQETVGGNKAFGETGDTFHEMTININNASHYITKLYWEENTLMAEIETLQTPMGFVLEDLLNSGCDRHLSYRGIGGIEKGLDGNNIVTDILFISFDFYAQSISERLPSDRGDYLTKLGFEKVD